MLVPSEYLHSQPRSSAEDWPCRPEPLHPAPPRCGRMRACELLLSGEVLFGAISVVNSPFCLRSTFLAALPSEFPKLPTAPVCEGISWCVETFPPSHLPPRGAGPQPLILCLPSRLYLFLYLISEQIGLSFWKSGVLCQHSEDVLWELFHMLRRFLDTFVREKVVSPSYSSAV